MIKLDLNFDDRTISSNVTEHKREKGIIEYEVDIDDDEITKEFGNPIFFKDENGFFGFKDSQNNQGERAISLLFAFKNTLNWFRDKQPDMEI